MVFYNSALGFSTFFLLHLNFDESWSPDVFFVTLKILTSHRWLPDVFFLFLEPQVSQIFIHVNRSVCAEISVFCTRISIRKNLFSNKTLLITFGNIIAIWRQKCHCLFKLQFNFNANRRYPLG